MKSPKNSNAISASSISGITVINPSLETIGTIEDVMIDFTNGDVLYAVLSVDTGFLNLGSKYFAIPLQEFQLRTEEKQAMLDLSKERLEQSPGFDKDNWPSGPQHQFVGEVNKFYGRTSRHEQTQEHGNMNRGGGRGINEGLRSSAEGIRRGSVSDQPHKASTDFNANTL